MFFFPIRRLLNTERMVRFGILQLRSHGRDELQEPLRIRSMEMEGDTIKSSIFSYK